MSFAAQEVKCKKMKRLLLISLIVVGSCQLSTINCQLPYVDDSYYWPEVDTIVLSEPVYDKSAREFIFLEDTTQRPDTVVMRIIEK